MDEVTQLRAQIIDLSPWHLSVQVTPEISTDVWLEEPREYPEEWGEAHFLAPDGAFRALMRAIYPDGLEGRSMLDCACNCGAYLFWAKELGAGRCFGFDIRSHWVAQARFLQEHRPEEDLTFEVRDLYELPGLSLEKHDVTLFQGILYHLPDPVTGLKIAADLTREVLVVNTATTWDDPDGFMRLKHEGTEQLMSGVYRLSWLPTGPRVLQSILMWLGFVETRVTFWRKLEQDNRGRMEMVASRKRGLLAQTDQLDMSHIDALFPGESRV